MPAVKPDKSSPVGKKEQVQALFDSISASYDKTNRFISLGMDRRWKKRLIKALLKNQAEKVLDLATGTADLPLLMAKRGITNITGIDISSQMLEIGRQRCRAMKNEVNITLLIGDNEQLPFKDKSFDALTVAYGLRNYENLEKGLNEAFRVLKSGGYFYILETSVPNRKFVRRMYRFFTKVIMPRIGQLFSGNKAAFRYLSESAAHFPCGDDLSHILKKAGFSNVSTNPQLFGAAGIYICHKT